MGVDEKYRHYHEKSSKWFREQFIDYTNGTDVDRDVHHHRIVDQTSGLSGEGFGWSYQQAETKAWDDLKSREGNATGPADMSA
jgi:hypothetical protein